MRKGFIFNLVLSCLLLGCSSAQERPSPKAMTADDALAAVQPVIDCEWAAAARYDNGHSSVAALAERIMGMRPRNPQVGEGLSRLTKRSRH
jgi:hypothetical protein